LHERLDTGSQSANGSLASHYGGEAVLENQGRIEILHLQEPLGGLLQSFLGNQSYDFAGDWGDAVTRGFASHHLENAMDGGLLEVSEIHGNLRQAADQESRPFHE